MCNGKGSWIRIYRNCEDNNLYFSEPFTKWQAFFDLTLLAEPKDSYYSVKAKIFGIVSGEVYTSVAKLSERWQWSKGRVEKFLKHIEKDNYIVQKIVEESRNFIIEIIGYEKYKGE